MRRRFVETGAGAPRRSDNPTCLLPRVSGSPGAQLEQPGVDGQADARRVVVAVEVAQQVQRLRLGQSRQLCPQALDLLQEWTITLCVMPWINGPPRCRGRVLQDPVLVQVRAAEPAEQRVVAERDGLRHGIGGLVVGTLVSL